MTRVADVDAGWVASKRRARVSWSNIARMAGCSEAALKARFETLEGPGPARDARAELPAIDKVRLALREAGIGEVSATVLARMWLANGAMKLAPDLTRDLGAHIEPWRAAQEARSTGQRRLGLSYHWRRQDGYGLMPASIVALARLAGVKP